MIQVTKMWVRSLSLDHLDLYWEIGDVAGPRSDEDMHDIFNYDIYILRAADSPLGPYTLLAGPYRDTYHFLDNQVSLLHKYRQFHYKLRVVDKRTGVEEDFGPASSASAQPDLIALEIMRQEDLLFREFTGRKCWLFPVRTFGPTCSCWDTTLQRPTRSGHRLCFGTGWMGGFMSPVEVYVQIDPSPKSPSSTSLQEVQQSDTVGRMISFPPVNPGDILVEAENRRWRVLAVNTTQRLRAVIRQELRLHEIPRGDIEYALPVMVDTQGLNAASARNFKNAQNLGNDGDYSDIISAYGGPTRGTL